MVRIIHAADLHLDSAFASLTPEQAAERRGEQREILDEIADAAERTRAQLVLLAGDLFDSRRCFAETQEALCCAFEKIKVKIFISPGNHDWYAPGSAWERMRLPGNVHVFRSPEPECVALPELDCTVWGTAFVSQSAPPPLTGFRADGSGTNIMVLHADFANPASSYAYISAEDIAASGLDYLALGHVHTFDGIKKAGKTSFAYPGCPLGRGFDETGEKGIIVGTVDKDGCRLDFAPLKGRKYEILRMDTSGESDIAGAVCRALPNGSERDIYRIILGGECGTRIETEALGAELRGKCYAVELRDETRPVSELWSEYGENTLRGGFVRRMKERYDACAGESERENIILALRYGIAAMDNRESV